MHRQYPGEADRSARHVRDCSRITSERAQLLISFADQFKPVPADVATRPFDKSHLVPACESEAYVWAVTQPDGTLKLHFAVENPSGISAQALATILDKTLSGLPPGEIATRLARDRRAHLPPEHLDGQGHGPDVDGRRGAHPGAAGPGDRIAHLNKSVAALGSPNHGRSLTAPSSSVRVSRVIVANSSGVYWLLWQARESAAFLASASE